MKTFNIAILLATLAFLDVFCFYPINSAPLGVKNGQEVLISHDGQITLVNELTSGQNIKPDDIPGGEATLHAGIQDAQAGSAGVIHDVQTILAYRPQEGLDFLRKLAQSGKLKASEIIDELKRQAEEPII